jgi:HEAT repeat protein
MKIVNLLVIVVFAGFISMQDEERLKDVKERLGKEFCKKFPEVLSELSSNKFEERFGVLKAFFPEGKETPRYSATEDELDLIVAEVIRGENKKNRLNVAEFLKEQNKKFVGRAMLRFLEDKDAEIRGIASWVLTNLGEKKYASDIVKLLKHKNVKVRGDAVLLLGNLKTKKYVKEMIELLDDKKEDCDLPGWTALALSNLGAVEALDALKKALKKSNCENSRNQIKLAIEKLESIKEKKRK